MGLGGGSAFSDAVSVNVCGVVDTPVTSHIDPVGTHATHQVDAVGWSSLLTGSILKTKSRTNKQKTHTASVNYLVMINVNFSLSGRCTWLRAAPSAESNKPGAVALSGQNSAENTQC